MKIISYSYEVSRRNLWRITFEETVTAIDSPVIVAVIVNGSFAIEEETILTSLECQRAVSAFVKLITVFRVRVQLEAIRFRTRADVLIR